MSSNEKSLNLLIDKDANKNVQKTLDKINKTDFKIRVLGVIKDIGGKFSLIWTNAKIQVVNGRSGADLNHQHMCKKFIRYF